MICDILAYHSSAKTRTAWIFGLLFINIYPLGEIHSPLGLLPAQFLYIQLMFLRCVMVTCGLLSGGQGHRGESCRG